MGRGEVWGRDPERQKGRGNTYLRLGCRACGKATPRLFDAEKFNQIFDDVFGIDREVSY